MTLCTCNDRRNGLFRDDELNIIRSCSRGSSVNNFEESFGANVS